MSEQAATAVNNESSPGYFGWRVLAASFVGMSLSPGPLFWGSMGVFVVTFQAQFGWDRAEIMLALTFVTISSIPAMPVVGRLIDKFGVRRVLLPSIVLLAATLLAIPLMLDSLVSLYVLFFLAGFLTVGTQSISYITVLASWFDHHRGLAIGITASGIGAGYAIIPPLVQWSVANYGWQGGYYVLAAMVIGVSLPIMALVIRNEPGAGDIGTTSDRAAARPPGMALSEAMRTREFWIIVIGILVVATVFNAMLPTMVPLLTDRGMTIEAAVFGVTVIGISMALSRVLVGYMIDRLFAPYVAFVVFLLAAIGLGLLAGGAVGFSAYVAAFLIGLGFGAETDLMGFLVSRYFGLRHFGQIYGVVLGAFLIGTGLGPYVLNVAYGQAGDYLQALTVATVLGVMAAAGFLLLRRYPERNALTAESDD